MTDGPALARLIDHTALQPQVGPQDIERLCDEATRHGFATVCVQPRWVAMAAARLKQSSVGVCSVVGFPLGQNLTSTKADEASALAALGADEIDMVADWGALLRGEGEAVQAEIRAVVAAVQGRCVKVILETASLNAAAIRLGCRAALAAQANFVKTSTGFGSGGADLEHVSLMRELVGPDFGVKASGGIRDAATARAMVNAGANRLGCSAGVAIVGGA